MQAGDELKIPAGEWFGNPERLQRIMEVKESSVIFEVSSTHTTYKNNEVYLVETRNAEVTMPKTDAEKFQLIIKQ